MSNGCDVNTDVSVYPIASPLPVECEILPSTSGKYSKRNYIYEKPVVTLEEFTPIKSQTPTPTVTPTISLTPSITPTNTPTPQPTITASPTVTPTVTPTITPTQSQPPKVRFEMDFSISLYTEVQIIFSTVDSTIYIYHATEGPFPLNPVNIKWRSYYNNTLITQSSGETDWQIPWQYILSGQKRFLLGDISASTIVAVASIPGIIVGGALVLVSAGVIGGTAAGSFLASVGLGSLTALGASTAISVSSYLGGGVIGSIAGTAAGVVAVLGVVAVAGFAVYQIGKWLGLWGKKKQPPQPKPYPQWSPKYQIAATLPKNPKTVQLYKGIIPDTVEEGDIYIEWGPSPATAGLMSIILRDSTKNASTLEPWEFGLVIEN